MSVKVSNWAWHDVEGVRGNELLALLALADIANDDGIVMYARPEDARQDALAAKAKMSVATFRRQLDALRDHGLVEVTRESRFHANGYRLLIGAQIERSVAQTELSNAQTGRSVVSGPSAHSYERSERSTVSDQKNVLDVEVHRAARAARGTRITAQWVPTSADRQYAINHAPSVDVDRLIEDFRDYWLAASGQKGVKYDWSATWRGWVRRAHDRHVKAGWTPQLREVEPGLEWMSR